MRAQDAKRALQAALAAAEQMGKAVSVAVVDEQGFMVAFERQERAAQFTSAIAEGKACASVFTGRDSGSLQAMATMPALASSLAIRLGGRFIPVQGAVVVREGDRVVGAVGVSGGTAEEDERIAQAGAATFPS